MNINKKVLHIATIDVGGSYNAAKRLNEMMLRSGIDSKVLVRTKTREDSLVVEALDSPLKKGVSKAKNVFNLLMKKGEVKRDVLGTDLRQHPLVKEADVIYLHWISTFLSPKEIYQLSMLANKEVIFVMHDMWFFTGGCHVDRRCGGYIHECVNCPMAGKYAHTSFVRKRHWIQKANIRVTGPSNWIVEEAKKSNILSGKDISVMPNVYDEKVFYPYSDENKAELCRVDRERLGLSADKKVILFGAADTGTGNENKGFSYLIDALKTIDTSNIQLCVIGNADSKAKELLAPYDVVYLGFISGEDELAYVYRTADIFVNPSLQESFGYTVCESMACGTPAVAFAVGGLLDQIEHKTNGYLAEFCNSNDLANGIEYVLKNKDTLSTRAAKSARRFSYSASDYCTLIN